MKCDFIYLYNYDLLLKQKSSVNEIFHVSLSNINVINCSKHFLSSKDYLRYVNV